MDLNAVAQMVTVALAVLAIIWLQQRITDKLIHTAGDRSTCFVSTRARRPASWWKPIGTCCQM